MTTSVAPDRAEVGNYFVGTYLPFSTWTQDAVTGEWELYDQQRAIAARPVRRFEGAFAGLEDEGILVVGKDRVALTRDGLLRVDSLLPRFFKPEHRAVRYT